MENEQTQPTENQHPGLTLAAAIKALEILETQPDISGSSAILGASIGFIATVAGMVFALKHITGLDIIKVSADIVKAELPLLEKTRRLGAAGLLLGLPGLVGAVFGGRIQRSIAAIRGERKFKEENSDKIENAFKALTAMTEKHMIGFYPVKGGGTTVLNTTTYNGMQKEGSETIFVEPGFGVSVFSGTDTLQGIKPDAIRDYRIVPVRAVYLSEPFSAEYSPRIQTLVELTKRVQQARAATPV